MRFQADSFAMDSLADHGLGAAPRVSKTMTMPITPCQPGAGRTPI
jgi:hypothetical protein